MVYVTGDMHGDPTRLSDPALRRLRKGDTLLVCGDFGFVWDGSPAEEKRLKKLARRKYTIAFLDGRHENFDRLNAYPTEVWNGAPAGHINDRLYHLRRGEIYTIEDATYFVFGGGESDDKEFRVPGESWWAAEAPTPEEMERAWANLAARDNRVDYILTHKYETGRGTQTPRLKELAEYIDGNVDFKMWYAGHWHIDAKLGERHALIYGIPTPVE